MTETEMVEVWHVILETICVLISRIFFSNSIEHVFLRNILQTSKYKYVFLNTFSNNFQQIDNKTNKIYLLQDFNINLLQNGKCILKENQSYELENSVSALVNKYKEFC